MIFLREPKNGARVSLATEYQIEFISEEQRRLRGEADADFKFDWTNVQPGLDREERSHPAPVHFSWCDRPLERGHNGRKIYTFLIISENEDLSSPEVYTTDKSSLDIYNLKIGTKYYWCVQKNGRRSKIYSFTTEFIAPRFIRIDGVSNVRDMGGYVVEGGKRVRQGIIYRGSEFENKMHISEKGINDLLGLKIRTDLDLRGESAKQVDNLITPLFNINRIFVPSEAYEGLFLPDEKDELNTFFSTFANPKNYPIYYHCRGGADRTGSYSFILGALYGMSLDDLFLEYELTSLSIWGTRVRNHKLFSKFLESFFTLPGETNAEKARYFLRTNAGLTDKEIDRIYEIALEDISE